jgi:tetratricopeptide (TPR) repeat protein
MDKYLREANRILDREIQLFQDGVYKDLMPSPEPIQLKEIQKSVALIQGLDPAIGSSIKAQGGWVSLKDGHQMALEFYERSLEANPNDARMHSSLGKMYRQDGDVKKAITEFIKALKINPGYPDAVVNLGDFLMRIKEDDKAKSLYAAYLAANPSDRDLLKAVANIGA